VLQKGCYS